MGLDFLSKGLAGCDLDRVLTHVDLKDQYQADSLMT